VCSLVHAGLHSAGLAALAVHRRRQLAQHMAVAAEHLGRIHSRKGSPLRRSSMLASTTLASEDRHPFIMTAPSVLGIFTSLSEVYVFLPQCLAPTYLGDFHLKGVELRKEGLNRIGNMLVPNSNYCAFEDWIMPIFEAMLAEQQEQGTRWTPSSVCLWSRRACSF